MTVDRHLYVRITHASTNDGTGHLCYVDVADGLHYRSIGTTRTYRAYPASVRANTSAKNIAYRYAKFRGVKRANCSITYA